LISYVVIISTTLRCSTNNIEWRQNFFEKKSL
jgi:hypothetical protein